jgi:hypothetical protein
MKKQASNYSIFVCASLLAFVTISCVENVDTDPKNLIGRWQMVKVIHKGETTSKPDHDQWLSEVEIEFLENGEIEGTLPRDTFSGNYKIAEEDSISFYCRSYSKVGETKWGCLFYDNIRFVRTFSLKKKVVNLKYKELYLDYDDGQLIFDRVR